MPIQRPKRGDSVEVWKAWYRARTQQLIDEAPEKVRRVLQERERRVAPYRRAKGPGGRFISGPPPAPPVATERGTVPGVMERTARSLGAEFISEEWTTEKGHRGWFSSATGPKMQPHDVWSTMRAFEKQIPRGGRTMVMAQIVTYDAVTKQEMFGGWVSLSHAVRSDVAWIQAESKLRELMRRYYHLVVLALTAQEWSAASA